MARRLPVRLRLTLWYTALLAGALLLFSGSVYVLLGRSLVSNLDTSLHQRINQLMPLVDVSNSRIQLSQTEEAPDAPYIPAALVTRSGQPVGPPPPAPVRSWLRSHPGALGPGFRATSVGGLRVATTPIENNSRRLGYLLVWQSLDSIHQSERTLLLLLLGVGPALLVLAGMGGMLLARRALSPVAEITHTAARISATDLQRRVPVGPADDELSRLAGTFNAMIERLQGAVERERRFTADASHELRSPLAVILAEASLALEEPVDLATYRAALDTIYEQAVGMRETLSALLMLARAETLTSMSSPGGSEAAVVSVASIVEQAVRHRDPVAQERNVQFRADIPPDLWIEGNITLLVRAVRNLLDNAVKASPPGGTVRIHAYRRDSSVRLAVEDEGKGISPEHLERIFEPFYQVEKARTPSDSHGLGLPICRKIVAAHGGEVTAESEVGAGARFIMTLSLHSSTGEPQADETAAAAGSSRQAQ